MSLAPCYRASCDADGCVATAALANARTPACRDELEALSWSVVRFRGRARSGAAQLIYLCPVHRTWRPSGWREAELAARSRKAPRTAGVLPPAEPIDRSRRAACVWMLKEAIGSPVAVAKAVGIARSQVSRLAADYEADIERRQRSAEGWVEPWARRLRAAGAIP